MNRNSILVSLLFALLANFHTTVKAQAVNVNDSLALVDLYKNTNGPAWARKTNWLSAPVSTWYGIIVTDSRVTKITLAFNNLSGSLPASIGNLGKLEYLDLGYNSLTGSIPASVGKLSNLTDLLLSSNFLTGTIPASVTGLSNIQNLALDFNELTGSIPADIGNLKQLTQLQLMSNQLSGPIPESVGKLSKLLSLYLSYNQLSGPIPFFDENNTLVNLNLDHNQLTGSIPEYFRNLRKLISVNLSNNLLSQTGNVDFPMADPKPNGFGDITNNHFTFDGIEFIAEKFRQVVYAQQSTTIHVRQHGNTLSVYAGGTLSNNTYKWTKVGKAGSTTITGDSTFTPTESGKYFVQVKNKIAKRLTLNSDTIDVKLNGLIANGRAFTNIKGIGVRQVLQVWPSPASSVVNVNAGSGANIILSNAAGKVILTKTVSGNTAINVSTLPNGIYYIQNKTTGEVKKIAVQH